MYYIIMIILNKFYLRLPLQFCNISFTTKNNNNTDRMSVTRYYIEVCYIFDVQGLLEVSQCQTTDNIKKQKVMIHSDDEKMHKNRFIVLCSVLIKGN